MCRTARPAHARAHAPPAIAVPRARSLLARPPPPRARQQQLLLQPRSVRARATDAAKHVPALLMIFFFFESRN